MKVIALVLSLSVVFCGASAIAGERAEKPKISQAKAKEIALKTVPGKLLGWCLEIDNGVPTYSFDIESKNFRINEIEIDGNTGEVCETGIELEWGKAGEDRKTGNAEDLALLKRIKVDKDKAAQKALKKFSGTVEAWELESEEGKLVYEFLISSKGVKKVVGVDAQNGNFTEITKYVDGDGI
ncbi:MAG: PepSY domain-containing protein [Candidatus Obscuribacterales bacterium]|nr:PepSY domain-containing protein [Candidatus Obscuribacterales bacterium]